MHTTSELLDEAKARHGITSEYRLTRTLGITDTTLRNYRLGATRPDDSVAIRLAELVDRDPLYVIACVNAQRSQDAKVRAMWSSVAERLSSAAGSALLALVAGTILSAPSPASARATESKQPVTFVYYVN